MDQDAMTRVDVRLSTYEKNVLRMNAAHAGCSLSEYVRQTAVYATPPSPIIVDMEKLMRFHFELRKEGVNLNQLARAVNACGAEGIDVVAITRTLDKLDAALDEVGGWIIGVRRQFKRKA